MSEIQRYVLKGIRLVSCLCIQCIDKVAEIALVMCLGLENLG